MTQLLLRAVREDSGQDLIEYAMLAAFISLVATAFVRSVGIRVNDWYSGYNSTIATIPTGS
jgi:Flp pilus assembly pilin Flp